LTQVTARWPPDDL